MQCACVIASDLTVHKNVLFFLPGESLVAYSIVQHKSALNEFPLWNVSFAIDFRKINVHFADRLWHNQVHCASTLSVRKKKRSFFFFFASLIVIYLNSYIRLLFFVLKAIQFRDSFQSLFSVKLKNVDCLIFTIGEKHLHTIWLVIPFVLT